jgi:hypothetical protein
MTNEPEDYVALLYRRAFEKFGARTSPADALATTYSLPVEGHREARRLAEQLEKACGAAL